MCDSSLVDLRLNGQRRHLGDELRFQIIGDQPDHQIVSSCREIF